MNNHTTYELLVHSEEKGRSIMETLIYALCVGSAVVAIWQFIEQPAQAVMDGFGSKTQPVPVMSAHAVKSGLAKKS